MQVRVNREVCIGAGTCTVVANNTFDLDDELKAVVKDPKGDSEDLILDAAKSCPVLAIIIEDDEGKQLYP